MAGEESHINEQCKNDAEQAEAPTYETLGARETDQPKAYFNALNWAFNNPSSTNIALVGPNGSGKTSLIRKYETQSAYGPFAYVSLGTLLLDDGLTEGGQCESPVGSAQPGFGSAKLVNSSLGGLQQKIVEQLLCYVRPGMAWGSSVAPYWRSMRRHPVLSPGAALAAVLLLIVILAAFPGVLGEDLVAGISGWLTGANRPWYVIFLEAAALYAVLLAGVCLVKSVRLRGYGVTSVKYRDVEVTGNGLPFDSGLDNIAHIVRATGRDTFVFEDLDRLEEGNALMGSLRELNCKLNLMQKNSLGDKKTPIRFIYCVTPTQLAGLSAHEDSKSYGKEDASGILEPPSWEKNAELATKFFDFIVPVVPVADHLSFYDLVEERFGEGVISSQLAHLCARYLVNRRVFNSVYNYFVVVKGVLSEQGFCGSEGFSDNQLFALSVVQTLDPVEYERLSHGWGKIGRLLSAEGKRRVCMLMSENGIEPEIEEQSERFTMHELAGYFQNSPWLEDKLLDCLMETMGDASKTSINRLWAQLVRYGYIDEDCTLYTSVWKGGSRLSLNDQRFVRSLLPSSSGKSFAVPLDFSYELDDCLAIQSAINLRYLRGNHNGLNLMFLEHLARPAAGDLRMDWENRARFTTSMPDGKAAQEYDDDDVAHSVNTDAPLAGVQYIVETAIAERNVEFVVRTIQRLTEEEMVVVRIFLRLAFPGYVGECAHWLRAQAGQDAAGDKEVEKQIIQLILKLMQSRKCDVAYGLDVNAASYKDEVQSIKDASTDVKKSMGDRQ